MAKAKETVKKLWTSKTFWASVISIVTGISMFATGEQSLQELTPVLMGAIFGILRLVTKDPVSL